MRPLDMDTAPSAPDVQTFRGRSLEEVLPQVRASLGPDAVVVRRREGLAGGVGGFFQRPYVEVEGRGPASARPRGQPESASASAEPLPAPRNDRATAEGLSSPVVQALVE